MRVVPISRSLADNREVLPFDDLKPKIQSASFRAVAHCPCRLMKKTVDEGCDHALENCLHFGGMGRYMVAKGIAREVTAEETFEILKDANEDGLVHIVDNFEGHMSTICNCCGCCCIFLDTQKKMGLHTLSSSNYVASVDEGDCVGCGTCESRCPVEAISLTNDIAAVDEQVCLGCAVCVPTCSAAAVDIVSRSEIKPPPDLTEFLTRRLKSAHE